MYCTNWSLTFQSKKSFGSWSKWIHHDKWDILNAQWERKYLKYESYDMPLLTYFSVPFSQMHPCRHHHPGHCLGILELPANPIPTKSNQSSKRLDQCSPSVNKYFLDLAVSRPPWCHHPGRIPGSANTITTNVTFQSNTFFGALSLAVADGHWQLFCSPSLELLKRT